MLSARDLAMFRAIQEAHMFDECVIYNETSGSTTDYWGRATSISGSSMSACGLNMSITDETDEAGAQGPSYDCTLRLPIATSISRTSKVKITKRFGETDVNVFYDVIGDPLQGPSGLVVKLKYRGA